jgi:hypothetical protein
MTATMDPIYISADHYVRYYGAQDSADDSYLNSGTCTFVLYNAAGASVTSGTCSYVASSNGNYRGVIESTTTSGLTVGAKYRIVITFVQGLCNDSRTLWFRAKHREKS